MMISTIQVASLLPVGRRRPDRRQDAVVAMGEGFLDESEPEDPGRDHEEEHDACYDAEDGGRVEARTTVARRTGAWVALARREKDVIVRPGGPW